MKKYLFLIFFLLLSRYCHAEIPVSRTWESMNGGTSAYTVVGWDTTVSGKAYLGGDVSGAYLSVSSGSTWESMGRSMPCSSLTGIFQSQSNSDVFYATCGYEGNYGYVGVFKSIDHAVTWTQKQSTWSYTRYAGQVLAIDRTDPNTVYAADPAVNGDIYKSTDGGDNWSVILADPFPGGAATAMYLSANSDYLYISKAASSGANVIIIKLSDNSTTSHTLTGTYGTYNYQIKGFTLGGDNFVCVTAGQKISCTTNHGTTWMPSPTAAMTGTNSIRAFDVVVDGSVYWIYAAGWTNFNAYTALQVTSKDGGTTWTTPTGTVTYDLEADPSIYYGYAHTHVKRSIAINPNDHNTVLYTSDNAVWKTSDWGEGVTNSDNGATNQVVTGLVVSPDNTLFSCGMDIGTTKSTDNGASWINAVGARPGDYDVGWMGHHWNCVTMGDAADWAAGNGVVLSLVQPWATHDQNIAKVLRSADNGQTWAEVSGVFPTVILYTEYPTVSEPRGMAVCPSDSSVVAVALGGSNGGTLGGIWISEDKGTTWTKTGYLTVRGTDGTWGRLTHIAFDPTDATCQKMAVGTRYQYGYAHGYITTTDRFATSSSHGTGEVSYLAYRPGTSDIYTNGGGSTGAAPLYKNGTLIHRFPGTDNKSSWVGAIYFDTVDTNRVFVSTSYPNKDNTVYVSENINLDASASWTDLVDNSLSRVGTQSTLTINYNEGTAGYLYKGGHGSGLAKLNLSPEEEGPPSTGDTVNTVIISGATISGFRQ